VCREVATSERAVTWLAQPDIEKLARALLRLARESGKLWSE